MDEGIGIWVYDEIKVIGYSLFFQCFFNQFFQKNFDYVFSGIKSYKILLLQCMCEGNRKIVFVNIVDICKCMKWMEEYVIVYLFVELGINGFVDGSRRFVIKGWFQQKQIENVVCKYISRWILGLIWDCYRF